MKAARKLFGQYRRSDAADPEQFAEDVARIFSRYPEETVLYVTDAFTGLAANPIPDPKTGQVWKGLPDMADVKKACENHYGPIRRRLEREALEHKVIEERNLVAIEDQRPKKTYAEVQAECHALGLMIGTKPKAAPTFNIDQFCEQHGVSRAEWDAIPNTGEYNARPLGAKR